MRYLIIILLFCSLTSWSQSATTETLHKNHKEALALFFYNNTLRMINQEENKEFDELIKDIEKMKFLMIDKGKYFGSKEYKKLVSDYKSESFEEMMTSRHQGKNFDVFIKEKNGDTKGMLVLVNDSTNLYVLDIVGKIPLNKVTSFYSALDDSADIGKKIRNFAKKNDDH